MSAAITGHRFDECYSCYQNANAINNGEEFQAIGHLHGSRTVEQQAECIHAVCLPCIQAEDASRVLVRPRNRSMRQSCGMCRALLSNSGLDGVRGRLFTVRPVAVMGEGPVSEGEDGVQVLDERGELLFHGEIINSEDMPEDPEAQRTQIQPINLAFLNEILRGIPDLNEQARARREEEIRIAAMSNIEFVFERIGRELFGRVVSLVIGAVAGAAFGVAYYGAIMAVNNVAHPEEGIFVPREELNGLSLGFTIMLVGGAVFGIFGGLMGAIENPYGDYMGRAGALTGKAVVNGLEGLNDQIERVNRAWADLFVAAAQQPVG